MREIKFRGIREEYNPDWHESIFKYGNLLNENSIGDVGYGLSHYQFAKVKPETVGQYTGLKDKNGKEIYEGDIVMAKDDVSILYVVKFGQYMYSDACFFLQEISDTNPPLRFFSRGIDQTEIIGNIHENPELIK